jgi:ABC-type transport system involved in Fe-S cluster assembly fused permease/ATPase subunit
VPRQVGIIANKLTETWGLGPAHAPFLDAVSLAIMSWLQGSGGITVIQDLAMVPIEQFSYRQVTQAAFKHVMGLSVDFHIDQNSGELMKALDQGRSLTDILRVILIDLGPTFLDVFIGLGYLYFVFGINACFTIILAAMGFFWIDRRCTNWLMPHRRKYISKIRTEYKIMHEAVQGWQTVTYFNRLEYEDGRMTAAIYEHQQVEAGYTIRKNFVALFRGLAVDLGFLCILMLAVLRISRAQTDVGSFVTLYAYWGTLISPLNIFGGYYRWLSSMLIDAERLLELFQTRPTVTDVEGANPLQITKGAIKLQDVHFAYDVRKETIKGISVDVKPGTTVAFVGETGAGKSTLLKLLYRLYNITSGEILIDGQDISEVTLDSLHESMGVVPQDPMLFNDSILVNLRYARLDATDEEIYEACKAARIHDKILTFPDAYQSKVGERGVKLSGGELQRVAIARVLLKQPKIVLLDEATSAIDTETEQQVQEAFKQLSEGRTTLVIAHRLSTIVKADLIVVLEDGKVIEQGTHTSLLEKDGKYARLWSKQVAHL